MYLYSTFFREHILFPFIDQVRMKYFKYEASQDGIVPDRLVASCSADGDKSQLATIMNEESVKAHVLVLELVARVA